MREMKNSGIEWIGDIPKTWDIVPHKVVMHKQKDICEHYNGEDIISLTMGGVVVRDLTAGGKMPTTFDGYQYVEEEDLLLCLFDIDVTPRCVGVVKNNGITSPAYSRFKVHNGFYNCYYDYLLRAIDNDKVFVHLSKNLRSSLTETDFGAIKTVAPPYEEQKKIADFLDEKCAEIDTVIEKTKATIEEYKKLKQSVITQAVTKGIRPNRPMKDSGIEWIGKIPADWDVSRLKNVAIDFSKGNGITKEDIVLNGDTPCVRYGEIYTKYNQSFFECKTRTNKAIINTPKYFSYGDILFTCTGELVEEIGKSIVYLGEGECLAGGDIVVLRHSQHPSFLNYAVNSTYAQSQKSCDKTKLKVVHISASDIANIIIVLPSVDEQEEIADYLDKKCIEIDELIAKKTSLLAELESYKKSLIYEYVTGKKEV